MPGSTTAKKAVATKKAPAKKAAATTKKAAPKGSLTAKVQEARSPYADISDEARDALIAEIMAAEDGCEEGKRAFIRKLGWPAPPKTTQLPVYVTLPVTAADVGRDGHLKQAKIGEVIAALSETGYRVIAYGSHYVGSIV